MRVKTLTLTTASAAALTIGLASPALALATTAGGIGAVHNQTGFGAHHQGALHSGLHHQVALLRGDDDDDNGDDDGGDDGGDAEIGGFHKAHHANGPRGLCGVGGHIGGFAHGCGEEGDDDDDDDGHGAGDFASEHSSACCGHEHVRVSRPVAAAPAPRRYMVPSGAVHAGFGGSQGTNLPLGLAGLTLLVGGAGLLPLARRRLQASARS
jgi:hypothetical protein